MSRAPIFIEVALHYWTCPYEMEDVISSRAYRETALTLAQAGLLDYDPARSPQFKSTEGLGVYINALCDVPLPVLKWVMP